MTTKIDDEKKEATLYLRDYLEPGGIHPYDNLPRDLEFWLAKGYKVSLISVPGWLMISGWPGRSKPWTRMDFGKYKQYKTAGACLKR